MHGRRTLILVAGALLIALSAAIGRAAPADRHYPPLTPEQILRLGDAIEEMTRNPRGPYRYIRWFCADGTILPPEPYACRPHGGGIQHGQLREEIAEFGQLGFHFGTVFAALDAQEVIDADHAGYRARELVVEAYLVRTEDGWVMRRAQYYRGARQAEDEERVGREILVEILSDHDWVRGRPLLTTRLVETIPHAGSGSLTERIRALALEVAEMDAEFNDLRVKLHSVPGPADIESVEIFRSNLDPGAPDELRQKLDRLLEALRAQYGAGLDPERWRQLAAAGNDADVRASVERLLASELPPGSPERIELLVAVAAASRRHIDRDTDLGGARTLALMELATEAADRASVEASAWLETRGDTSVTRRELLALVRGLVRAAYADGWLNERELQAQERTLDRLLSGAPLTTGTYHNAIRYLERAPAWAHAAAQQTFAMVTERYLMVEPAVHGLEDDLLRGSVLLPLSRVLALLATDAAAAAGQQHEILGNAVRSGVLGLNPGVAFGPLHIATTARDARAPDPRGIYVLPETPPELGRVAGILTLGQGSRLSHVQLLARGLGIPNAAIAPSILEMLQARVGEELVYSVSPRGSVHLDVMDPETAAQLERARSAESGRRRLRIDESRLDLSVREVLPLEAVGADDAGRIAGPKAANLGQLHQLFPDRVAPGLVVPFGVFRAHMEQAGEDGRPALATQIASLFDDPADVRRRLAEVREQIESIPMLPAFERQLRSMLQERFGEDGTYGVFVRSDTNVEDLPNFSGAGLNLTVMNVIGTEAIFQAIRDVWASPFTERAYGWRSEAVDNPAAIYPSIVILGSVASEASGVLVTRDIDDVLTDPRGPAAHWTVALSPGVGGGVEGEATETTLIPADGEGSPLLLSSARAPWRKVLRRSPPGGIVDVPVESELRLLTDARLADLRPVINRIRELYPPAVDEAGVPMPWDIEFGFLGDRTILFQIRPFIAGGAIAVLDDARALDERMAARAGMPLDLGAEVNQ